MYDSQFGQNMGKSTKSVAYAIEVKHHKISGDIF